MSDVFDKAAEEAWAAINAASPAPVDWQANLPPPEDTTGPGPTDPPTPEIPETPDEEPETEPGPDDVPEPTPDAASEFTLDGRAIPIDELRNNIAFVDLIRSDPIRARQILGLLDGTLQVAPVEAPAPPTPPSPPPNFEFADDTQKWLYQQLEALKAQYTDQMASYQQAIERHDQLLTNQQMIEAQSLHARARRDFQASHSLSNEEMDRVDAHAAELGILPALVSRGMGRLEAMERTYTLAMRDDEKLYERSLASTAKAQAESKDRKARASSVASGPGSVPRTPATPTPQTRDELMLSAFREVMGR